MKDSRVTAFHKSLEELVESLDATLRVAHWDAEEVVPDMLQESASKLVARLGTADRLASGVFKGNDRDVSRVHELTGAMRRLETTYLAYRKNLKNGSGDSAKAAEELIVLLEQVKTENLEAG